MTAVLVIGAGLAGSLLVERLHERGVATQWVDAGPTARASSCPCALVHPFAGRSFQPRPHVFEAWAHVQRFVADLGSAAQVHAASLVRRIGEGATGERLWSSWTRHETELRARWPGTLRAHTEDEGTRVVEYGPVYGLSLRGAVQELHTRLRGEGIAARHLRVTAIVRGGDGWIARDDDGRTLTTAARVVVAAGAGSRRLLAGSGGAVPLEHVEGTLSHGPGDALPRFWVDAGHVASTTQTVAWGASYRAIDRDDTRDHDAQLEAIAARLRPRVERWPDRTSIWRGVRVVDPHARLPVARAVADGVWAMTGFGSQGALWIPWAADRLATELANLSSP